MHRAALKSVVKILAMRRGAVDEGGTSGVQRSTVTDHGARAVIVPAGQRAFDVILVTRGDAQTDDIDQQILAFARGCCRQTARLQRNDFFRKRFSDGDLWQFECHDRLRRIKRGTAWYSAP